MQFTINDPLIEKAFPTFAEAKEHFQTENIIPVLTVDEYKRTNKDYKGIVNGKPYVLYLSTYGTTYGPCFVIQ